MVIFQYVLQTGEGTPKLNCHMDIDSRFLSRKLIISQFCSWNVSRENSIENKGDTCLYLQNYFSVWKAVDADQLLDWFLVAIGSRELLFLVYPSSSSWAACRLFCHFEPLQPRRGHEGTIHPVRSTWRKGARISSSSWGLHHCRRVYGLPASYQLT